MIAITWRPRPVDCLIFFAGSTKLSPVRTRISVALQGPVDYHDDMAMRVGMSLLRSLQSRDDEFAGLRALEGRDAIG